MAMKASAMRTAAAMLALMAMPLAAPARAGAMNALSWMAGAWAGEKNGTREEEHWMAPRGDLMVGMHRTVRPGKPNSFEFLRIQERPEGLVYLAQPDGAPVTAFKMVDQTARRVVFENKEHDYPQRIIYWQDKPNELRAMIAGTLQGKPDSMQWRWTRVK